MYNILYSKTALKSFKKIPTNKSKAILEKIEALRLNPYQLNNNIKKLQGLEGYRLRIGDYRVIYRIEKEELIILIIDIDVRGEIYK